MKIDCESDSESRLRDEKLEALRQLAYGASHEINNPLGNIASRAQMLAQRQSDPELKRQLATIYQQAMRAHEMISDMMLFAHPPDLNYECVTWDFFECEIRSAFSESDVQLEFATATTKSCVECDPTQLLEAVAALIKNGIEAAKETAAIQIEIQDVDDQTFVILVEDSGPGVSDEIRPHMFDPFYSGREAGRGLGFGLSKAWTIAKQHGGNLTLEEKPSPGCRFAFQIPASQPDNGNP